MTDYKGPVCRGSWALGTACQRCERCIETKPRMVADVALPPMGTDPNILSRLAKELDTERTRADEAEKRERELREGITAVLEAWETAKGNDLFYRLCALIQPEADPLVEAIEAMRQTAKELRECPNRDCNLVMQAIMWENKALDTLARHRLERSEPVGWMVETRDEKWLSFERENPDAIGIEYTETPLYTTTPEPVAEIERLREALWTPGEKAWAGLARDLMMAFDMGCRTPREIFQHLDRCGKPIPQWLRDEGEMKHLDHVPSKGTRAMIIYRAMLEPALAALGEAS